MAAELSGVAAMLYLKGDGYKTKIRLVHRELEMTLSLRTVIAAELRRLGADAVYVTENGGRKHPKICATINGRVLTFTTPRGNVPDKGHLRANYIAQTRRLVRALQQRRGA